MSWWCCCDTAAADRAHPHPRDPKYDRLIPTNNLLLSSTGGRIEGARPDPGGYSPPSVPASASRVPTIDDFVLLKTLGKGTFGKVGRIGIVPSCRPVFILFFICCCTSVYAIHLSNPGLRIFPLR